MDATKANDPKKVQPEPDGKAVTIKVADPAPAHNLKPPRPLVPAPSTYLPTHRSQSTHGWDLVKISELILRVGAGMLALMAFSVMFAATETRNKVGNAVFITLKFSDFQAYNYLVVINMLAVMYSILQLIALGRAQSKNYFYSASLKCVIPTFICDQLIGYLLFSASSSAATASELSRSGVGDLWASICSDWELNSFCIKADGAIGLSFFASVFVVASSLISGYNLAKPIRDMY